MKKFITLVLSVMFVVGLMAQTGKNRTAIPVKLNKKIKAPGKYKVLGSRDIPNATPVGLTNYDLQTNDGVARRLINHGDGTFSTVWIQYHGSTMPSAPERGSGYNYFDGTSWLYTAMSGNEKIEASQRTGWPALVALENGNEFVVNHYNGSGGYFGWKQTIGAAGSGWTQKNAPASQPLLWPRAAAAGDTIHTFGVVDYDLTYEGQSPAPVYMRSTDGGDTWDGLVQPTGITSEFFDGISGDSYTIDANGSVVAIVVFNLMSDFVLFKSIDNGDTWTKTIIADFPEDMYSWSAGVIIDKDGDTVADSVTTVNGADVVVDANGLVHVAYSTMLILDDDAGDDAASYFFGYNNYIHYWNDDMPAGVYTEGTVSRPSFHELYISTEAEAEANIGWTPDVDGSGIIGDGITGTGSYGFGGWCGFPSIAIDDASNVFISFSATMEGDDYLKTDANPEPQNFKQVFIATKKSGTWSDPVDVTSIDGLNAENVYCTLAKKVDDNIYMQFQWDGEPGCSLKEKPDGSEPITDNYILFKQIPVALVTSVNELEKSISVMVFPNPTTDMLKVTSNDITKIEIFNTLGAKILSTTKTDISLNGFATGTYFVKVYTKNGVATKKVQKI